MTPLAPPARFADFARIARLSGALYLAIIVCGVGGQAFVRDPLLVAGDAAQTLTNLTAARLPFRLSILADTVMALCDVALAVLLFTLLKPLDPLLSRMAMTFRIVQASILGLNLVNLYAASATSHAASALVSLEVHAAGYDLALFFFGVSALITGTLLRRVESAPRWLGPALWAAGAVYLMGSSIRVLVPPAVAVFSPAYGIPLLAELSLCVWLLAARRPFDELALRRAFGQLSAASVRANIPRGALGVGHAQVFAARARGRTRRVGA